MNVASVLRQAPHEGLLEPLEPDSASLALTSLAKLGYAEERLIRRVLGRCRGAALRRATARQLSNLVWACAMLKVRPEDAWLAEWQQSMQRHLEPAPAFTPSSSSIPAAGGVGTPAPAAASSHPAAASAALDGAAAAAAAPAPDALLSVDMMAAEGDGQAASGLAATWPLPTSSVDAAPPPPPAPPPASVAMLQQLSTAVYALGKLGHRPDPSFMGAVCGAALEAAEHAASAAAAGGAHQALLPVVQPRDVANLCAGLAACRHLPDDAWVERFMRASAQLLGGFSLPELQRTLGALAGLGCRPSDAWLERFYDRCQVLLLGAPPAAAAAAAGLSGQSAHSVHTAPSAAELSVADMAGMTSALARLGCRPDMRWMDACLLRARAALPRAGARELTELLAALAQLQYRPGDGWMQAYLAACLRHLGGYGPEQAVLQLQSLLRLGQRPSPIWLHELVAKVSLLALLPFLLLGLGFPDLCTAP